MAREKNKVSNLNVVWSHGWTTKEAKALCKVCGVVSWLDYQGSQSSVQGLWCGLMVGLPRKLKLCARCVVWSHGWTTKEAKALCTVCGVVSWLDYQGS